MKGIRRLEYDTIDIAAPTHLQLLADLAECPVSQLHDLNPALLKNIAPAGRSLRVPKGSGTALAAVLDTVPPEKRAAWRVHRVAGGETLGFIAQRYRVTENSILAANRAGANALEAGDLLIIPVAPVREKPSVKRAGSRRGAAPPHPPAARSAARSAAHRTVSASAKPAHTGPGTYTAANVRPHRTAKHTAAKQ